MYSLPDFRDLIVRIITYLQYVRKLQICRYATIIARAEITQKLMVASKLITYRVCVCTILKKSHFNLLTAIWWFCNITMTFKLTYYVIFPHGKHGLFAFSTLSNVRTALSYIL